MLRHTSGGGVGVGVGATVGVGVGVATVQVQVVLVVHAALRQSPALQINPVGQFALVVQADPHFGAGVAVAVGGVVDGVVVPPAHEPPQFCDFTPQYCPLVLR